MDIILYPNKINGYLKHDCAIDYANKAIMELADMLFQKADNELDFIKKAYELLINNDIRMRSHESIVIKGNMANDT